MKIGRPEGYPGYVERFPGLAEFLWMDRTLSGKEGPPENLGAIAGVPKTMTAIKRLGFTESGLYVDAPQVYPDWAPPGIRVWARAVVMRDWAAGGIGGHRFILEDERETVPSTSKPYGISVGYRIEMATNLVLGYPLGLQGGGFSAVTPNLLSAYFSLVDQIYDPHLWKQRAVIFIEKQAAELVDGAANQTVLSQILLEARGNRTSWMAAAVRRYSRAEIDRRTRGI